MRRIKIHLAYMEHTCEYTYFSSHTCAFTDRKQLFISTFNMRYIKQWTQVIFDDINCSCVLSHFLLFSIVHCLTRLLDAAYYCFG